MNSRRNFGIAIAGAVLLSFVVSFFFDPIMIQPVKLLESSIELDRPEVNGIVDPEFRDTVINSTWAMVLTHSEFSRENAGGLEALRNWARQKLISDRQYLDPLNLPKTRSTTTVFDSFFNSFLGLPLRLIENSTASFLKWRLGEFQETPAYQSFRVNYYELFGVSQESARLLLRYQEERAKGSISILLSAVFWACFCLFFVYKAVVGKERLQNLLSLTWLASAAFYLYYSIALDSILVLVGSLAAVSIGLFLLYPVSLKRDENTSISLERIELSPATISLIFWATISLFLIQVVNWIKGGILTGPDPFTLLIGALTGNFLHDPVGIKRSVLEISGATWLLFSLLTIYLYKRGSERSREVESKLRQFGKQKVSIQ